jgi:hypothetical protein
MSPTVRAYHPNMGLAERRAAKDFQDNQLPPLQAEISMLAGTELSLEINWEELATANQAHLYADAWPELYFKPVIAALRQITRDQMGKDAVASGLKKLEIRNSKGAYSPASAITFASGTLAIDHDLSNVGDTDARAKYIVELLEKSL